jgi:hypothetical protein
MRARVRRRLRATRLWLSQRRTVHRAPSPHRPGCQRSIRQYLDCPTHLRLQYRLRSIRNCLDPATHIDGHSPRRICSAEQLSAFGRLVFSRWWSAPNLGKAAGISCRFLSCCRMPNTGLAGSFASRDSNHLARLPRTRGARRSAVQLPTQCLRRMSRDARVAGFSRTISQSGRTYRDSYRFQYERARLATNFQAISFTDRPFVLIFIT